MTTTITLDAFCQEELPRDEGVSIKVKNDFMVTLTGERKTVEKFVKEYWGDETLEDALNEGWFS